MKLCGQPGQRGPTQNKKPQVLLSGRPMPWAHVPKELNNEHRNNVYTCTHCRSFFEKKKKCAKQ